ncbi:MAG TPA: AfsR/SARP family transcriptional regulator [Streptosporangiaceae bacterium]
MTTPVLLDDEQPTLPAGSRVARGTGAATRQTAEFSLLGPVEARAGGELIDLGAARERCVLAVLLLDANRCVSADQIVERVWGGGRLPRRPRGTVQTYVSFLRHKLIIVRQPNGYMISLDEQLVDVHAFRALIKAARAARRDDKASALFEQALGLWQGEAFGALDTPWLGDVRAILDTERRAAERDLADIGLRQGQHGALLPRLAAWAARDPLDERLAGQLMLALYRSGRQADALAHYERSRRLLVDDLGLDASDDLQRLRQQILSADPALALRAVDPRAGARSAVCAFTRQHRTRCLQQRRWPDS